MAERRMFTKKVTDDENFINLSSSAQALYLHLSMSADDDGFTSQISVSMFKAHASVQDMEALLEKRYVYQFDNGVIVIKHWRMANALRKDRYTPTAFQEELAKLDVKENGSYTMVANRLPSGCQVGDTGKDSIGKNSKDKNIYNADSDSVIDYLNEKANTNYRHADGNRKFISARLKEGFSVDDCKTVIDKKCQDWLGTEYEQYLRPKTLFGNKFEGYLNANVRPRQKDHVVIDMPDYMRTAQQKEYDPDEELPF